MSPTRISAAMRQRVRERAKLQCEYCLLAEYQAFFPHEPDHIIAEKHGGPSGFENLALCCFDCNRFKGSNIASLDPETGELTPLFDPRMQKWTDHFVLNGGQIIPLTPVGRATVQTLRLNLPDRLEVRETLSRQGRNPDEGLQKRE